MLSELANSMYLKQTSKNNYDYIGLAGLDVAGDDMLDGGVAISAPAANMLLGDDALVPTRQLVKKQSSRTTIEARRKAEAAIRAKRCV